MPTQQKHCKKTKTTQFYKEEIELWGYYYYYYYYYYYSIRS